MPKEKSAYDRVRATGTHEKAQEPLDLADPVYITLQTLNYYCLT